MILFHIIHFLFNSFKYSSFTLDYCTLVGTDGYRSPEQIQFAPISDKTDMWAIGCIIFEIMSKDLTLIFNLSIIRLNFQSKVKNPVISGTMAFRTRDEDEYTRRVINGEWSFKVNQEWSISCWLHLCFRYKL